MSMPPRQLFCLPYFLFLTDSAFCNASHMFEGREGIDEERGGLSQSDVIILAVLSASRARRVLESSSHQGHT